MPFLLHAMRFLEAGGRLAFVLPYEMTYVRYARPLWNVLSSKFGSLHVLRSHERLFPELLQDVVILLADNYGARTSVVRYQAFERVADLLCSRPVVDETIAVNDLIRGKHAFVTALLGSELRQLLDTQIHESTVPARNLVTFNIGYVAGDKKFFHPAESVVQGAWNSCKQPARRIDVNAHDERRMMKGAGLRTSSLDLEAIPRLFIPNAGNVTAGELSYIKSGEQHGVAKRYKRRRSQSLVRGSGRSYSRRCIKRF